jgi:hypothetical protein
VSNLIDKINHLSPAMQLRVEKFVDSLMKDAEQEMARGRSPKLRQRWAGGLRAYREQYTSVELQKETLKDWVK